MDFSSFPAGKNYSFMYQGNSECLFTDEDSKKQIVFLEKPANTTLLKKICCQ